MQRYELVIRAEGELRDADGNLISSNVPVEGVTVVTEEQAKEILKAMVETQSEDEQ